MTNRKNSEREPDGLRERKRRDTHRRITEAGLKLFSARGFDATTLDAIAAEAGISRRTFFHYFRSKDDILLSLQTGLGESLAAALAERAPGQRPIAALRQAMHALLAAYAPDELLALDRLMLSSEAVQSRKQATYLQDEALVFAALCAYWPEENPAALRLAAILSIGITRVSMEAWRSGDGQRPLAQYVDDYFDALAGI
ncbi:Transcriptional regulator, TetR family [Devosia sp. LC5]|uniref:TetR family transcriptional regulator n=1 Tax=Devosia sp. LC5 TaxID=1502724 RepID=UPI0004E460D7|nr:TetR family transcriptional regulator [Devosia sp. LC5]KFC69763.1 Transcriptional regulator, TetR family [Devosia sp. LC5]